MKVTIVFLFLLICAVAHAQSAAEKQLFDFVNHEREKAGVSKLQWNDGLAAAALAHSKLLNEHQDLSHQFAGEPPVQQRLGATGVRFNSEGENVAEAPDVPTAHSALMHSPGHRANILNPDYNSIGIAIVQHGQQLFVTQDFAHVLVSYTEKQFQDAVVSSFNHLRRGNSLPAVNLVADSRLRKAACSQDMNTNKMIQNLPGATRLLVFSASDPGSLPDDLRKAASDPAVERMNLGVCLQTGGKTGFSKFWVVAAFYRTEK